MNRTNENIEEYLKKKNFQKRIDKLAQKYKNKKIMFYGASMAFDVIKKNFDISKLNIIGIADIRFTDGEEYAGYKTFNSYTFLEEKPDIVLITMLESEIAEYFFEDALVPKFGDFKYEPLIKDSFIESVKELLFSS